jgi:enediyne biosynthesis protein E4
VSHRYRIIVAIVLVVAASASSGCGDGKGGPGGAPAGAGAAGLFREITETSGVDFRHHVTVAGKYAITELMGAGLAIFDANGDGRLDLYFVDSGETKGRGAPDRLFLRDESGRYRDATEGAGLDRRGFGTGVAAGDVDNDGDVDLYVGNWGGDGLYLNDGAGRFTDVTARAGIRGDAWTSAVAFVDYDLDGLLDIYVAHYLRYDPAKPCAQTSGRPDYCGPEAYEGVPSTLYRNRGDGAFEDVSRAAGIDSVSRHGLGVIVDDFDGDGWPDVYVANDGDANHLWINQKNGRFTDEALALGVAVSGSGASQASMGLALADVDADGSLDLFITNSVNESNILYLRAGPAYFRDATAESGLAAPSRAHTGFGTSLFDADHDGDHDLAVVNGRVARGEIDPAARLDAHWNEYAERNQFFLNDGRGRFAEEGAGDLGARVEVGRGLGAADLDGDGDLDLVMTGVGTPARVFENVRTGGHWLKVRVRDERLKRDAFGARVAVHAGGKKQLRVIGSAVSYFTSCVGPAHFGLGAATAFDRIEVVWPGGETETFPGGAADREVVVTRGGGAR